MTFDVAVETRDGRRMGSGPISTVTSMVVVTRLDRAGTVEFSMPASDPAGTLFPDAIARYVRLRSFQHNRRSQVGHGIVRKQDIDSGSTERRISGQTLESELAQTIVGELRLGIDEDHPMPKEQLLSAVMSGALPGWSTTGVPSKGVYYKYRDETHLAALVKLTELTGDHWRLSRTVERRIEWLPSTPDGFDARPSGVRAVDSIDPDLIHSNPTLCLIVGGLRITRDDTQRITRIYPRGRGNGTDRLYLTRATMFGATGRGVPGEYTQGGFTLHIDANPALCYIAHTDRDVDDQIGTAREYPDITPLSANRAAETSASNQLGAIALKELQQSLDPQLAFQVDVTSVRLPLVEGDTIRITTNHTTDGYRWQRIDQEFLILEVRYSEQADDGEAIYSLQVTA